MNILPAIESRLWPRLIFAVGLVVAVAHVAHTEIELNRRPPDAWGANMRVPLLHALAEDNAGLKVLDPEKLEKGERAFLPTPVPISGTTAVHLDWKDGPVGFALENERGPREEPSVFRARVMEDFAFFVDAIPPQERK